ncbi:MULTISPECIES: hypothetical protein [Pseudomonas]|jgi:hypothetical protein|uniref:Uncharacterized protein n=1 Tax=Pseudomonas urmiensis TaxID=2745493 RepID=A0ABW8NW16_9PSED|nr:MULTISPECIES: hypothetical protein [unclassified Pseudomonas]MCV9917321.1 hypothetical protein [Pseudomonas sp. BT-42-2]
MSGKFVTRWFYASLESGTKPAGLFGNKVEVVHNQKVVDFDEYAAHLQKMYEDFDHAGYDVINVVPIAMGQSESCTQTTGNYVGDVGFSITRGAVVVGKRRDS